MEQEITEEKINFIEGDKNYATDMPVLSLALLFVFTLGVYDFIWRYLNLRLLGFVHKRKSYAFLITLLAITAFFTKHFSLLLIIDCYLYYGIFALNERNKIKSAGKTILLFVGIMTFKEHVPYLNPYYYYFIIIIIYCIPLLIAQNEINKFINKHRA